MVLTHHLLLLPSGTLPAAIARKHFQDWIVFIGASGLELSQTPYKTTLVSDHKLFSNDNNQIGNEHDNVTSPSILLQNEEVKREKGIWYNLKILSLNNRIDIYVDGILRIKAATKDYYHYSSDEK